LAKAMKPVAMQRPIINLVIFIEFSSRVGFKKTSCQSTCHEVALW
jgi:hypothetical protein